MYSSHYIVRVIEFRRLRWVGRVARMEECRNVLNISTGKPTEKRQTLGRPRRRWEDSTRKVSIRGVRLIRPRRTIIGE